MHRQTLREPGRWHIRHNRNANSPSPTPREDSPVKCANEVLTDRLRLRPPTEADAERVFARYAQDSEVCRYMSWIPHRSIDDTVTYLKKIVCDNAEGRSLGFLIFSRQSGELLGSVGGSIDKHRMQFGYCLARDAWGHGFATEAAVRLSRRPWKSQSLWRIQAFCDVENCASAHVLEKDRAGTRRHAAPLHGAAQSGRRTTRHALLRQDSSNPP